MIYVIQKHFASHLHWDLRLEMDGVLKSWAVPKEPSMDVGVKRLAILVEDHDIEYADFEGEIPKGSYGAGIVQIWDKGSYNLVSRSDFKIELEIFGEKLSGRFMLVHMNGKQWLFYRKV